MRKKLASKNDIRTLFSRAMSHMYQNEVPAYGTLIQLVQQTNADFLRQHPDITYHLSQTDNLDRINEERHGAIRLGTAYELQTIGRLFAVMGMEPVGYYDLSIANIPVHSTAFRPIHRHDLSINPFRVFTSLLRLDLIPDSNLRTQAIDILNNRTIFTKRCLDLIQKSETDGYLCMDDAETFVNEAIKTFQWHQDSLVSQDIYQALKKVHSLVADVVCFKGPHINHLTPRTLDIDICQNAMPDWGIHPKAVVEGPPQRTHDILLRQTAFKALTEPVTFTNSTKNSTGAGTHTARFGEIEQRGVALTPKGRALYDTLLNRVREKITPHPDGSNADAYYATLQQVFSEFPDDIQTLHQQKLAYYEYHLKSDVKNHTCTTPEELIAQDLITLTPIVYEDFLPISAAGIFQSNLGDEVPETHMTTPQQQQFETALGRCVIDTFCLYEAIQQNSIDRCLNTTI